jgi:hypothetical protein
MITKTGVEKGHFGGDAFTQILFGGTERSVNLCFLPDERVIEFFFFQIPRHNGLYIKVSRFWWEFRAD